MKKNTIGIFSSRKDAEKFINYAHDTLGVDQDDISYVYKNIDGEVKEVDSEDVSSMTAGEGAVKGAKVGAVIGALGGLATVAGVIPVIGALFVAGPLVAALGIAGGLGVATAGAATGAIAGGLTGALVGLGTGEKEAKQYEDMVLAGNILVAVRAEDDSKVRVAMIEYHADRVETYAIGF